MRIMQFYGMLKVHNFRNMVMSHQHFQLLLIHTSILHASHPYVYTGILGGNCQIVSVCKAESGQATFILSAKERVVGIYESMALS